MIRAFSQFWGAVWFSLIRYRRGVILQNLARAFPERSAAERRAIGRGACVHLIQSLCETLRMEKALREGMDKRVSVRGLENLNAARAGQGAIILTGHLGSFELCAGAVAQKIGPQKLALVVKELGPGFQQIMTRLRTACGTKLIEAERSMPDILRQLKAEGAVAFVLDQNATRQIGVFVDFFGEPASTMAGLALIALRKNAPIVPCRIWREDLLNIIEFSPPLVVTELATRDESIVALTQQCTHFLEDCIRAHPEQWLWTHKRWKTRPLPAEASPSAPAQTSEA